MKITEYPEVSTLNEGDVVLIDGPTGTHTIKAEKLGSQAILAAGESLLNTFYPVGSVYLSFDSVSPAVKFGGSWAQISGRFLRAANDTTTGGADTITLTAEQSGLQAHGHGIVLKDKSGTGSAALADPISCETAKVSGGYIQSETARSASSSHSNMPLYQDVYAWRRVA